ncbi:bacteriohemerythrin [Alkaliphilus oremlandii]|uniref:Hemerythrin-like metal-binding protein n=1 Tax=Alkaliphilus oremlandii (strain OhILAs) TaxID=350688 RepID=A8MLQ1_ALKOO|nr:bacteriohemerythrin [Alkaliphilus oremlandii]ABW17968.1 hemerythrin-like metal-binding protein [Alkaliphilus oremlandii OhILAs]
MFWWSSELETGITSIDEQHRTIFNRAGDFLSLDSSTDLQEIHRAFVFLMDYCINHFTEEEQIMMDADYESLEGHRAQHNHLVDRLYELGNEIKDTGINEELIDQFKFLVIEWLVNHINESDKHLAKFLLEK